jgi:very-short-patch-repair endonuclease
MDVPVSTGREPDSPFEEAVMEALRQVGYEVQPQVGSAGFFIDIAVVDKNQPGRYLLGIECDGATYHSARSARDRDRLRQQVLEGLGWKIHRIWSTDWFRDPVAELKKTVAAIEVARLSPGGLRPAQPPVSRNSASAAAIQRDTEQKRPARAQELPKYVVAKISVNTQGMRLDELGPGLLADYIAQVVKVEGPVHVEEVFRRITNGAGLSRTGTRIEEALRSACASAQRQGLVYREGHFLWPSSEMKTVLRSRAGVAGVSPKLEMIAAEEIGAAITRVIADAHGLEQEKVFLAACQLFGYARVGEEMRQRVSAVIDGLIGIGQIVRAEGNRLVIGTKQ